jgi:hypothetical protein
MLFDFPFFVTLVCPPSLFNVEWIVFHWLIGIKLGPIPQFILALTAKIVAVLALICLRFH